MSFTERLGLLVDEEAEKNLDILQARYDLPRKVEVFTLALFYLAQIEKEDEGFILGFASSKENTFFQVPLAEVAEALFANRLSSKVEKGKIRYTLFLAEEVSTTVERLRVRFKLHKKFQVFHLAAVFLKNIAAQEDRESVLGLYNKKNQTFHLIKIRGDEDSERATKSLLDRIRGGLDGIGT